MFQGKLVSPVSLAATDTLPTVVKCSILVILVIVNFAGNGLTIEAIRTTRRLRTKTNFLVGGLAVSDLAVGLMEAFHITWNMAVYVYNAGLCRFRFILAIAPPFQSMAVYAASFHVSLLAIDRYTVYTDVTYFLQYT